MSGAPMVKIAAADAKAACALFELEEEAQPLAAEGGSAAELFDRLVAQGCHADAARLLAFNLPRREAVWWACLCVRDALGPEPAPGDGAAVAAAERWAAEPTEENRRAAMAKAEALEFGSAAAWAAVAAFWSAGSMAPADVPPVVPGPDLAGKAVAGAVMLAAADDDPAVIEARYKQFLARGADIARGGKGMQV